MDYSLWFRGAEAGGVTLEPPDADGARIGRFRPTDAYWHHRPELQSLTLGLAALQGKPPKWIAAGFAAAVERVQGGNLELRDLVGAAVDAEWLMIGDYGPAELTPAMRDALPILVYARISIGQIT